MLLGGRSALFLDEMGTGLDSATLYRLVYDLGRYGRAFSATIVGSLLQPPPEVFALFDDLILMAKGCGGRGSEVERRAGVVGRNGVQGYGAEQGRKTNHAGAGLRCASNVLLWGGECWS